MLLTGSEGFFGLWICCSQFGDAAFKTLEGVRGHMYKHT